MSLRSQAVAATVQLLCTQLSPGGNNVWARIGLKKAVRHAHRDRLRVTLSGTMSRNHSSLRCSRPSSGDLGATMRLPSMRGRLPGPGTACM